jgi:hypothetical protein
MIQYILNIVKKNIESKFQIFLSISLIKMWYVKPQFLFNNIPIFLIFLFDPASSVWYGTVTAVTGITEPFRALSDFAVKYCSINAFFIHLLFSE